MGSFQITGEMMTLMVFIIFGILGIFRGISNIRVEMAERMARMETDIDHIKRSLHIRRRPTDKVND